MEAREAILKLKKEFDENINSHVFLVETNSIERSLKDVKDIIKGFVAPNDEITARQIDEENYLELIIIRPDGNDIKKDQIMDLQERLKLKPILSPYMIYIIESAESLNEIASNKLLKTIEEPNQNIIGFLLTSSSDAILPTIKSRCEIVSMNYKEEIEETNIEEEVLKIASSLVMAIEHKDHLEFSIAKSDDKLIKENAKTIENLIKDYYNTACNLKENVLLDSSVIGQIRKNNDYSTLIKKTLYINSTMNKLTANMNCGLLLEKLFLELKEVK